MSAPIKVWCPDDGGEPNTANVAVGDDSVLEARRFARFRYITSWHRPAAQIIHVRMTDGTLRIYTVETQTRVAFVAFPQSAEDARKATLPRIAYVKASLKSLREKDRSSMSPDEIANDLFRMRELIDELDSMMCFCGRAACTEHRTEKP